MAPANRKKAKKAAKAAKISSTTNAPKPSNAANPDSDNIPAIQQALLAEKTKSADLERRFEKLRVLNQKLIRQTRDRDPTLFEEAIRQGVDYILTSLLNSEAAGLEPDEAIYHRVVTRAAAQRNLELSESYDEQVKREVEKIVKSAKEDLERAHSFRLEGLVKDRVESAERAIKIDYDSRVESGVEERLKFKEQLLVLENDARVAAGIKEGLKAAEKRITNSNTALIEQSVNEKLRLAEEKLNLEFNSRLEADIEKGLNVAREELELSFQSRVETTVGRLLQPASDELNRTFNDRVEATAKELVEPYRQALAQKFDDIFNKREGERVAYLEEQKTLLGSEFETQLKARVSEGVEDRLVKIKSDLELELNHRVDKEVESKLVKIKEEIHTQADIEAKKQAEDRLVGIKKDIQTESNNLIDTQVKKQLAQIQAEFEAKLNGQVQEQVQKQLVKINTDFEAKVDNRVQEQVSEKSKVIERDIQAEANIKIEKQVAERLLPIKADLEAQVDTRVQQQVREKSKVIQAEADVQIENQVKERLIPIKANLEAEVNTRVEEQVREKSKVIERDIQAEANIQIEQQVQERLVSVKANLEAQATLDVAAKVAARIAEDQAERESTATRTMANIDQLEEKNRRLRRDLKISSNQAEEAVANFEALQEQLIESDQTTKDDKAKIKSVEQEIALCKAQAKQDRMVMESMEHQLKETEQTRVTLQRNLNDAQEQLNNERQLKQKAEERYQKELIDGVETRQNLRDLEEERKKLEAEKCTLSDEIKEQAENLKLFQFLENEIQYERQLNQQMVDQLNKFRAQKPAFIFEPHAYDAPEDSQEQRLPDIPDEIYDDTSVSEPELAADSSEQSESGDESVEVVPRQPIQEQIVYVNRDVLVQKNIYIPATRTSHSPLACWLGTEERFAITAAALAVGATRSVRRHLGRVEPLISPQNLDGNLSFLETGDEAESGGTNASLPLELSEGTSDENSPPGTKCQNTEYEQNLSESQDSTIPETGGPPIDSQSILMMALPSTINHSPQVEVPSQTLTASVETVGPDLTNDEEYDTHTPLEHGSDILHDTQANLLSTLPAHSGTPYLTESETEDRRTPLAHDVTLVPKSTTSSRHSSALPESTFFATITGPNPFSLREHLQNILSFLLHLVIYLLIYLVIDAYLCGNNWYLANESTRLATQRMLGSGRGGYGQTWYHWVLSEEWAVGLDSILFSLMGADLVSYQMPG